MFDRSVGARRTCGCTSSSPTTDGEVHAADDDLAAIKAPAGRRRRARRSPPRRRSTSAGGSSTWDLGDLPQVVETAERRASPRRATRRCSTTDDSVSLRVLTNADLQQRVMHGGVRRLLLLTAAPTARDVLKGLTRSGRLAIAASGVDLDGLVSDCHRRRSTACCAARTLPWDADAFDELQRDVRREAPGIAAGALARAGDVLVEATAVRERAGRGSSRRPLQPSVDDATAHLDRLVRPGFVRRRRHRPPRRHRPLRPGDRVPPRPPRRRRRSRPPPDGRGRPAGGRYAALRPAAGATGAAVVELGWRLEELRVSMFAQPIGAKGSVSTTKLRRELAALQ